MKRKVVAVTGGIGSGKSTVCSILREMGYATVNCDALAKQVADEPTVVAAVEGLLGSQCVTNGALNRAKIREIVFADKDLLAKYNQIFFGRVRERLFEAVNGISGDVFVEIAVINAFQFDFDEIWLITCPEHTQIVRVTARDNVSAQNVEQIMRRQNYAEFTREILNDGSIDDLKKRIFEAIFASGLAK